MAARKVKNNVLLIDKGILKIMDDGYYIFISERKKRVPVLTNSFISYKVIIRIIRRI